MIFREVTPYVVGLMHEKSSGEPSFFTAWGVYRGIQAALKKVYNSDSVRDRIIAIQGLGNVGMRLAELLFWHGARLIVADTDSSKVLKAKKLFQADAVAIDAIYAQQCDVFSPCALGGIIRPDIIACLQTRIIAGGANNQLLEDRFAEDLMEKNILYAPDFVINSGGLINVANELVSKGYHPRTAWEQTDQIFTQLTDIYDMAEKNRVSTHQAAESLAQLRLKYGIGSRNEPVRFHHAEV